MTRYQALFVAYLRMKCEYSWRAVAGRYERRYEDKLPFTYEMSIGGNQITGIELCKESSKILNIIVD